MRRPGNAERADAGFEESTEPAPSRKAKNATRSAVGSNEALEAFRSRWTGRKHQKCPLLGSKYMAMANLGMEKVGGLEAWKETCSSYLDDKDPWLKKMQHPLGYLLTKLERYTKTAEPLGYAKNRVIVGGPESGMRDEEKPPEEE